MMDLNTNNPTGPAAFAIVGISVLFLIAIMGNINSTNHFPVEGKVSGTVDD
jgi:hypothetical protein